MWTTIKQGWRCAWRQPFAVCALFIYNLAWGVLLYKLAQSVILPLLHRYPGQELPRQAAQLFWIEGHFQLLKTDVLLSYGWWGVGLLALRMLLHPMLNAGVFYSLHHRDLNAGYRFVEGIRRLSLRYFGLYGMQMLLALAPLYWLIPHAVAQYGQQASYLALGKALLPLLTLYAAYLFIAQLCFLFLQLGALGERSTSFTLLFFMRYFVRILMTALIVFAISATLALAAMASAFVWAGFIALLGMQAFRLVQMFCKLWAIGAQYELWLEKA